MRKPNMGLDFAYQPLMYHVIPLMHNANFVNKYGDFGTPSMYLERFKLETSYLVRIFNTTRVCHMMSNYPLRWARSGSSDLNLKFGRLHNFRMD